MPIFPELRTYLDEAWDAVGTREQYVINRYRDANANLRTQLQRIIGKAGLEAWPKLFANLRASRATELAAEHPAHVAAAWLGHSTVVANKHYWQVTDADFEKATALDDSSAAQNAAQSVHEPACEGLQDDKPDGEKTLVLQGCATPGDIVHKCLVGDEGLEPPTSSV